MTLTQIRYFLELCNTMNFTKAAQNLFISQPTLSRQLQLLEDELGTELVKRSNREVLLTPAGKVFYSEFYRINNEIKSALKAVRKTKQSYCEIRVGFSGSVIPTKSKKIIEDLLEFYPGCDIKVTRRFFSDLKAQCEDGSLDLVFSMEEVNCNSCNVRWQIIEELPAYIMYGQELFPENYQPTLDDFKSKMIILSSQGGTDNIIHRQREILRSLGMEITNNNCIYTEDVVSALMFTYEREGFSIFSNPIVDGLKTMPLPDSAKKFHLVATWNYQAVPHLTDFFNNIK